MEYLPQSVQEVADVIGRERALYLVGRLPRTVQTKRDGRTRHRIFLYVPKRLPVDHQLVKLVGWPDAAALVREFGGMILNLESCHQMAREFRNKALRRMASTASVAALAVLFDMTEKNVRLILEDGPEEREAANDNDAANRS